MPLNLTDQTSGSIVTLAHIGHWEYCVSVQGHPETTFLIVKWTKIRESFKMDEPQENSTFPYHLSQSPKKCDQDEAFGKRNSRFWMMSSLNLDEHISKQ